MNDQNKNEILNGIDAEHIEWFLSEEEKNKRKPVRARILVSFVAAALVLVLSVSLVAVAASRAQNEEPKTADPTDVSETTKETPDTMSDIDKVIEQLSGYDGYLIGKGVTLSGSGRIVKKMLPAGGKTIQMTADYSNVQEFDVKFLGENPSDAPVFELYAQWMTSQLSFDYARHFSLFPWEVVNDRFVKRAESKGIDYETALARISEMTRFIAMENVSIVFTLTDVSDQTQEYRAYLEKDGHFSKIGLDPQKVSQALSCSFTDVNITFNRRLWIDGRGLYSNGKQTMIFYCYDGIWYCDAKWIDDDLSLDFISDKKRENMSKEIVVSGTIVSIGDDCVVLDNGVALINFKVDKPYAEGDKVTSAVCYRGAGLEAMAGPLDNAERVRVYSVSGEIILDTSQEVIVD